MAKHQKIVAMSREGTRPQQIAEALDTTRQYVYKVRSEHKDEWAKSDTGNDKPGSERGASEQPEKLENKDIETDTGPGDLPLDDTSDAKEYDCGGCGEPVEYLQKRCSDCGEQLMWSAMGGQ